MRRGESELLGRAGGKGGETGLPAGSGLGAGAWARSGEKPEAVKANCKLRERGNTLPKFVKTALIPATAHPECIRYILHNPGNITNRPQKLEEINFKCPAASLDQATDGALPAGDAPGLTMGIEKLGTATCAKFRDIHLGQSLIKQLQGIDGLEVGSWLTLPFFHQALSGQLIHGRRTARIDSSYELFYYI